MLSVIMAPQPVVRAKLVLRVTPPMPGEIQVSAEKLDEVARAAPVSRDDSSEKEVLVAVCAPAPDVNAYNAITRLARMIESRLANITARNPSDENVSLRVTYETYRPGCTS